MRPLIIITFAIVYLLHNEAKNIKTERQPTTQCQPWKTFKSITVARTAVNNIQVNTKCEIHVAVPLYFCYEDKPKHPDPKKQTRDIDMECIERDDDRKIYRNNGRNDSQDKTIFRNTGRNESRNFVKECSADDQSLSMPTAFRSKEDHLQFQCKSIACAWNCIDKVINFYVTQGKSITINADKTHNDNNNRTRKDGYFSRFQIRHLGNYWMQIKYRTCRDCSWPIFPPPIPVPVLVVGRTCPSDPYEYETLDNGCCIYYFSRGTTYNDGKASCISRGSILAPINSKYMVEALQSRTVSNRWSRISVGMSHGTGRSNWVASDGTTFSYAEIVKFGLTSNLNTWSGESYPHGMTFSSSGSVWTDDATRWAYREYVCGVYCDL